MQNNGDNVYEGNNCITKYWAGPCKGHIPCKYDALADELKARAIVDKMKTG